MLKKIIFTLFIFLIILPLFYWNRTLGMVILILEVFFILFYKKQTIFVRIFISVLTFFYSYWIYFSLSGFLLTHYFSIKQLVVKMNQTESRIFEIKNDSLDSRNSEIQKEMKRLGFYYALINASGNKITFSIQGNYWNGNESAENPFTYTNFTFFAATSYPTEVYIKSYY